MNGLTDEQRKRIEENRQKALEKLARTRGNAQLNPAVRNGSSAVVANGNSTAQFRNAPRVPVQTVQDRRIGNNSVNPSQKSYHSRNGPPPQVLGAVKSSQIPAAPYPPFRGPTVTGTCTLISRDRFVVDMGYHPEVIKLFKNIPGSKYDPNTKKWNFPLQAHSAVLEAVDSLKPQATVCPLPRIVLKVFQTVEAEVQIPDCDWSRIDPVLVQALLPFQRDGVKFGISRRGRVLIADDMGLGKTIQALGIAHYYYSEWPLMVVTPSSMRFTWRESIWNWLPSVPGGSVVVVQSKQDYILDAKVIILSYDLLQRRVDEPPIKNCKVIIVDESHHLKNYKAVRTKAAIPLLQNCNRAILLSGTPALSRPMELYNQIIAIDRNYFPHVNDYIIRYCNGKKTAWGYDAKGASNMEELQLLLRETIMIRRLKDEVLNQLPSKRRTVIVLDPSLIRVKSNKGLLSTASAYANEKREGVSKHGRLLEYFSETGKAKLDAVKNYVSDLVESDKKFLCFAHHKIMLDGICETLDNAKIKYIRIDGQVLPEERQRLMELFQFSEDCLVAVLSLTAANAGLTLTAASLVVFAELYWNPGLLIQAEDRVHRIGQQSKVVVQYLVAKGTADDALWNLLQEKLDVLNKAGLCKDNFRDINAEPAAAPAQAQPPAVAQSQPQSQSSSSQKQKPITDYFGLSPSKEQRSDASMKDDVMDVDNVTSEDLEVAAALTEIPVGEFTFSNDDDDPFPTDDSLDAAVMDMTMPDDSDDELFRSQDLSPILAKKFRSD